MLPPMRRVCVVSCRWWRQWCAYTRYRQQPAADGDDAAEAGSDSLAGGPEAPPAIDNSDIVFDSKLRDNLEEGTDFVIVSARFRRCAGQGLVWALCGCAGHNRRGGTHTHTSPAALFSLRRRTRVATVTLASCIRTVVCGVCAICCHFLLASTLYSVYTQQEQGQGTLRMCTDCPFSSPECCAGTGPKP